MVFLRVKNIELVEVLILSKDRSANVLVNYILNKYNLSENHESSLAETLGKTLIPKFNKRWATSHRVKSNFFKNNASWLNDCYFEWSSETNYISSSVQEQSCSSRGRPEKDFESLSDRSKRRRIHLINEKYSIAELKYALQYNLRAIGKRRLQMKLINCWIFQMKQLKMKKWRLMIKYVPL